MARRARRRAVRELTVDPTIARRAWRALEAVHGSIYFTPDAPEAYARIGVTSRRMGYFASRSAPMGPVPAEVVIATFYNFEPGLVRRSIPAAWSITTPADILAARLSAADTSLRRAFAGQILASDQFARTVELVRSAALRACALPEGRPLFAGHASLPWPDEPHLALWHAQSLLREFRGDGHVAALTLEGLSGLDALVSHAASGDVPAEVLRVSRAWSEEAWSAAVADMAERGLIRRGSDPLAFTDAGRAQRDRIESATDRLAARAYAAIGEDACGELRAAGRVLSKAVADAGLLIADLTRYDD